jgi:ABC-2 type transport system ATP-binding protein
MDPEGVLWVRRLFRRLAAEGRTVFLSSHLMSEMANTADELVVIGRGRLIAAEPVHSFAARNTRASVAIRTPHPDELTALLTAAGAQVEPDDSAGDADLVVVGLPAERIAELAFDHKILLYEVSVRTGSLEEAFMRLTADSIEYATGEPR